MKTMKLVAAVMTTLTFSSMALAASSATLVLQGSVGSVNNISVAADGTNNTQLNITGGESAKSVGTATETSNDVNGYKIYLSSDNGGQLRLNGTNTSQYASYTVAYNGGAAVTPPVAATATDGVLVKTVSSLTAQTTATSGIAVDVTAVPNAVAGTYSDTLTVSIVGN